MSRNTTISTADTLRVDTVQSIVREAIVILGFVAFMMLGMILPGTGQEIPGTAISIADIVIGLGSLGIVGSLIWAGPKLRAMVVANLEGPDGVLSDAASIVRYLAVFVAVLVAHWGFAPVLVPILGSAWAWDTGFLLLALVPIGVMAYRLYHSLDPLATFLTAELVGDSEGRSTEPTAPSEDGGWS